ncbi:MAG: hypothetical protein RL141_62 [Candidatus Parcubacteria bacterium]|jgi:hypothetical protein
MPRAALLIVPFLLLGAGCALPSKEEIARSAQDAVTQAAERGAEEIAKHNIGKDVDIDMTQHGAVFRDPVSGRTIAIGEKIALPEGFPADIPLFPDATPTSAAVDPVAKSATLLVTTTEPHAAMRDWYAENATALGWAAEGTLATADRTILSFTRPEGAGTAKLTITVMPRNLQKEVMVLVARKGE